MTTQLTSGTILGDTYMLVDRIGRGGMGEVWRAQHTRLPKQMAVKVLHGAVAADSTALARFRREAEIASRLGHTSIVEVMDFNTLADGTPYMVMELLEGESLRDRVRRGPLTLDETVNLLRQVASALADAHEQGIVHRDLKPDNIFITPDRIGNQVFERVKVLDFGISKIRGSQTVMTRDAEVLGTPVYMAPEQATGQHSLIDGRTDQFALGAIAYELLTGIVAFGGETLAEVVVKIMQGAPPPIETVLPNLPTHVKQSIDRALAKQPDSRFTKVTEFVEALAGAVSPDIQGNLEAAQTTQTRPGMGTPAAPPSMQHAEMLAATMASQDGMAVASGSTPAPGAVSSPAAMAATMVSVEQQVAVEPPLTSADAGRKSQVQSPVQRSRGGSTKWAIIAGAGVLGLGVAVAVGVMLRANGGGVSSGGGAALANITDGGSAVVSEPTREVNERDASVLDASVLSDAAATEASSQGDAAAHDTDSSAAQNSVKHIRRKDTHVSRAAREAPEPKAAELSLELRDDLDKARDALNRGNLRDALAIADRTLRKAKGEPARQRRRAAQMVDIIKAKVYCKQRNLSGVIPALRRLTRANKRRTVAWCRAQGFNPIR